MLLLCAACNTISSFVRGCEPGPSCQERFQHALMAWQHPDSVLPSAVVSMLTGSKASQGLLDARIAAWQESFRSLFMALRSGACQAFYFATPQASTRRHDSSQHISYEHTAPYRVRSVIPDDSCVRAFQVPDRLQGHLAEAICAVLQAEAACSPIA